MGLREERVAKNEAVVREINEQIKQAVESIPPDSFMHIVCECGYEKCDRFIAVTKRSTSGFGTTPSCSASSASM